MESGAIIFEKVFASPRLPPKISCKDDSMKELDSEIAGGSEDSQQIQPKSKTQLSRTERPLSEQPSVGKDVLFGCECTNSRTVRLVSGQPTCLFTQLEKIDIDFRVSGLPHAVVKQAENFRVRELVKKIESHPHREALQADLQQNNVYNPLSNNSKAMIRGMGNVELFESCETIPKLLCSQCLLCWNQGMIYCTCGQFLVESESSPTFNKLRMDALSLSRGARHGETEAQKQYHIAWEYVAEMLQKS